jgi:hypothetical protein
MKAGFLSALVCVHLRLMLTISQLLAAWAMTMRPARRLVLTP